VAPEPIDWSIAARVARVVAGGGPQTTSEHRAEVRRDFAQLTARSDELVRGFTHLQPPPEPPEAIVVSRAGWIDANIGAFRELVQPLTEKLTTSVPAAALTRRVVGAGLGVQIGILLGYLSQKVLGQYDLMLATGGAGRVYYVGPNVVESERRFDLDARDFRLWIALHEVTHRTQFTGVPWLRERVKGLIERSLGAMDVDPARVKQIFDRGRELLAAGPGAWKRFNVMDLVLSPEQREMLGEVQALMTVVEGHGTFVMNRVGEREIASFAEMREALEARRGGAKGAERVFQRAIGMDMKYEQYTLGERFCNEVAERAGVDAVNKLWDGGGENMPTLEEMRDPDAWLRRVGA
jgi:coenzyme F420 biosynthesis associated uncharacterized protein